MTSTKNIFLLTHPRSASNMFQKMLSEQPDLHTSGYIFYDGALAAYAEIQQGPLSDRSESDRKAIFDRYQNSYQRFREELAGAASGGRRIMLNEHALFLFGPDTIFRHFHPDDSTSEDRFRVGSGERDSSTPPQSNPTCLPDATLLAFRPVFQIRSPLLMFPSMVRTGLSTPFPYSVSHDPCLSLRYSRLLYEWYAGQSQDVRPLVIDADDIMDNRDAVRQLCTEAGLDPEAVRFEWETSVEPNPFKAKFKATLNGSTGILPGFASEGLSLESETPKWVRLFGENDGRVLAELVRVAMPDYEFLRSRRVTGAEDV